MDGNGIARMYEDHACWLQVQINSLGRELRAQGEQVESLRRENAALRAENAKLKRRLEEPTGNPAPPAREIPPVLKPNVADGPRRKPGRPAGHQAAWRPRPKKVDAEQEVALAKSVAEVRRSADDIPS